jgi:hypothetical protein
MTRRNRRIYVSNMGNMGNMLGSRVYLKLCLYHIFFAQIVYSLLHITEISST